MRLYLLTAMSGATPQHSTTAGLAAGRVCGKGSSPAERWARDGHAHPWCLLMQQVMVLRTAQRADLAGGAPDKFLVCYSLRALLRHLCCRCLADNGTPCSRSATPLLAPKVKRGLQKPCQKTEGVVNMSMWQLQYRNTHHTPRLTGS